MHIWTELLGSLRSSFASPSSIPDLFAKSLQRYPGPSSKNKTIRAAWSILAKIICWQIWLERNKRIFRNHEHDAKLVVVKIKCQLKECLREYKDDLSLSQQDINWGSSFDLQFQKIANSISLPKDWQIRVKAKDFQGWITNQLRHYLFFDGAAKGNPGRAGAGGVILNPDGIRIHSFAWGLGIASSTQDEALALFQGLKLLKVLNIREANVIGDSQVIINTMVTHAKQLDLRLARLIFRITDLRDSFQKLNFYHLLRANNKEAGIEAKKVALLTAGALLRGRHETWEPIP